MPRSIGLSTPSRTRLPRPSSSHAPTDMFQGPCLNRHAVATALVAAIALAGACDADDTDADDPDLAPALAAGSHLVDADPYLELDLEAGDAVAYVLAWSWEGAARQDGAWVFESDLGYTIAIEAAHASTSLVELVPCVDASADVAPTDAPPRGDLALARPAPQAAHSGSRDDSAATAELAQSIVDAEPLAFGAGLAGGTSYCDLHLLAAPFAGEADDGASLTGEALVLRGWWSAPGDPSRHDLDASINLQRGGVVALAGRTERPEGLGLPDFLGATLVITRYPARAFDGIELGALTDAELAYEVLGRMMQGALAEVALRE